MADEFTTSSSPASSTATAEPESERPGTPVVENPNNPDPVSVTYDGVTYELGGNTDADGVVDKANVHAVLSRISTRSAPVQGNLADLQRGGASVIHGGQLSDGVQPPPGVDPEKAPTMEDVQAPGPSTLTAAAAEATFGDKIAQGPRGDDNPDVQKAREGQ